MYLRYYVAFLNGVFNNIHENTQVKFAIFNIKISEFDCGKAEPNGFFPDPEQCDLYYECLDGVATPTLCPDGLMFDDTNSIEAKCDYPFNVNCGTREYVRK